MNATDNLMESLGFRCSILTADTAAVLGTPQALASGAVATIDWSPEWPTIYPNQDDVLALRVDGTRFLLPEVLVFDPDRLARFEKLAEQPLEISTQSGTFRTAEAERHPAVVAAQAAAKERGAKYWDGQDHARLAGWDPNRARLVFQRASYSSYLATNLGLDAAVDGLLPLRRRDRRFSLHALGVAPFANVVGVNVLAFSRDRHAFLTRRGPAVLVRPDQASVTWSGTLAWDDLEVDPKDLSRARFDVRHPRAIERWLSTAGLPAESVRSVSFLGLTRELIRGGIPTLHYAVDLDLDAAEWTSPARRRLDFDGAPVAVDFGVFGAVSPRDRSSLPAYFAGLLRDMRGGTGVPLSVPLLTLMALWYGRMQPAELTVTTVQAASSSTERAPKVDSRRWTEVRLVDFVAFADTRARFGPGINLIIGGNSSGKSHLLQMLYALERTFDGIPAFPDGNNSVSLEGSLTEVFGSLASLARTGGQGGWSVEATYADGNGTGVATASWKDQVLTTGTRGAPRRRLGSVFFPAHDFLQFRGSLRNMPRAGLGVELDVDTLILRNRVPQGDGIPEIDAILGGRRLALDQDDRPFLKGDAGNLSWARTADGWKRLATLSLLLYNEVIPGSVFYWDEPDDAINPELFQVIGDRLVDLTRKGVQVFVATHSLALVRWIHMCALDPTEGSPAEISYTFLEPDSTGTALKTTADLYDRPSGMVLSEEEWDRRVIMRRARRQSPPGKSKK